MLPDQPKFELIEITDPSKLPSRFLSVSEEWPRRMEYWNKKLPERGVRIKQPLALYSLTRKVGGKELCLELEVI